MDEAGKPGELGNLQGPAGHAEAPGPQRPVFISYASHDASLAQKACSALEAAGILCWIAPRDVVPGTQYADGIVHAIDDSSILVLIVSKEALASAHVDRELERAASKRHPVVALRIDTAPLTAAFEYFLNQSQWIEAGAGGADGAIEKLVEAVGRHLASGSSADRTRAPQAQMRKVATSRRVWGIASAVVVLALLAAYFLVARLHLQSPAAIAVADKSIAVLPFVDMSEKKDQEYFSDGLSEELIDLLAQVQDLRVPARTSSFAFKGKADDVTSIAQKLRVANVLEGSVRKAGNTLRVTVQLIRADNGYHLWSRTYDRDIKDIFNVQDEIAAAVVEVLKAKLAPAQAVAAYRSSNTEAYNQYLLGKRFHSRGNVDGWRRAIDAFHKAISLDPEYAAAYASLALSEYALADSTGDAAGRRQAMADAERAVTLAPQEADGYASRGVLRMNVSWDWNGAEADLEKALALDPAADKTQGNYATLLERLGRLPEAITVGRRATEIDPLSAIAWSNLGLYLTFHRDYPASDEALRRCLEINPESSFGGHHVAILRLLEGNAAEALATARKIGIEAFRLTDVASAEHSLGQAKESQQALDELIVKHAPDGAYQVAEAFAWRGEKDKAFEWLERAYQQRDGGLSEVKVDLLLDHLHGDPRFKAFLKKMNLPE
jgi:TolB-like protein/Tfp pilus assembly protein PilF